ncbi:hypothetical protein KQ51_01453 [Candidatus Izimaplasma bacterium HR1]|jgi:hypothetical protein|uniref:hypothetical protein n=1 Tax=Candidatus Izimoplasma sp. HR1 TaxID=1541959 RepID=UPI0004F69C48|nr:hypothetical protein KQ51_01453 [Candidatus Izimaplasma bacterium HR1]
MPNSKKRVKKQTQHVAPITKNIVKTRWGRVVIVVLALSFVLSGLVGLIYTLVMALQT